KRLEIPTFVVFDSDADKPDHNGSREKHRKDNTAILKLCSVSNPDPFPVTHLWGDALVMWSANIEKTIENEIGGQDWSFARTEADETYGHAGGLRKNTLHIATSLLLAWQKGKKSESLQRVCNGIVSFA